MEAQRRRRHPARQPGSGPVAAPEANCDAHRTSCPSVHSRTSACARGRRARRSRGRRQFHRTVPTGRHRPIRAVARGERSRRDVPAHRHTGSAGRPEGADPCGITRIALVIPPRPGGDAPLPPVGDFGTSESRDRRPLSGRAAGRRETASRSLSLMRSDARRRRPMPRRRPLSRRGRTARWRWRRRSHSPPGWCRFR